jgi:microcystin-dependent protein
MADNFLAEIRMFSFDHTPQGWAACNGQILPINQNQALFSLMGTMYGGNGQTTFALPDLRGRVPMHFGNGFSMAQVGGQISHTVTLQEMPTHTHIVSASADTAGLQFPSNNLWADGAPFPGFSATGNTAMHPGSVTNVGGSQPHSNQQPFLAIVFGVALIGIFPSRN